jgi:hypothetical protein
MALPAFTLKQMPKKVGEEIEKIKVNVVAKT